MRESPQIGGTNEKIKDTDEKTSPAPDGQGIFNMKIFEYYFVLSFLFLCLLFSSSVGFVLTSIFN